MLFGNYVPGKNVNRSHLVINDGAYGVVVDSSTNQTAVVSLRIGIVQAPGPVRAGQVIDGLTVQLVGSPF